jgi:hypothetical protein
VQYFLSVTQVPIFDSRIDCEEHVQVQDQLTGLERQQALHSLLQVHNGTERLYSIATWHRLSNLSCRMVGNMCKGDSMIRTSCIGGGNGQSNLQWSHGSCHMLQTESNSPDLCDALNCFCAAFCQAIVAMCPIGFLRKTWPPLLEPGPDKDAN